MGPLRRYSPVVLAALAGAVALGAQGQEPVPPTFRSGVDVIRLDVSVLDKDRRPVRGLTRADFTIEEDGKRQTIVAVSEIDAAERDPRPTAWMRYASRDVATNNLADQLGDGRLYAIVIDDWNLPDDGVEITMSARTTARYIIDGLGPSDLAAVVFTQDPGRMQEFTDDRSKLLAAIDRYNPRPRPFVGATPRGPSGGGADMPMRYSPVLNYSECWRNQPTVPTLSTVVGRLTTVPDRRKTLIFISTGVPLNWGGTGCQGSLADEMRNAFRKAERGNVNIHTIDPAGYRGYADYLTDPMRQARPSGRTNNPRNVEGAVRLRREFLQIVAENTGGRSVVDTDAVEPAIDRIFEEEGSYYLVGYETSNPKTDGKFRRLDVKVNRPGMTVLTRSGNWAPKEGSLATNERRDAPETTSLALTGLTDSNALPVRGIATPLAMTSDGHAVDVAVVLTVRLPPSREPLEETATIVRTIYNSEGRNSSPVRETRQLSLVPGEGDALRYDIHTRVALPSGRHELRYHVTSAALGKSGTVYVEVEVPDYRAITLGLTPIVIAAPEELAAEELSGLVPVVPASTREFASGETFAAFVRVFQGGLNELSPVTLRTEVFDRHDVQVFTATAVRPAEAFEAGRSADYTLDVPLVGLPTGRYLLSISASLPGGRTMRRDSVFRIR